MEILENKVGEVFLTKIDCSLISLYLELGLEYAEKKDLLGIKRDIQDYILKFKSVYKKDGPQKDTK